MLTLITVAGGHSAGKHTVCRHIAQALEADHKVVTIELDVLTVAGRKGPHHYDFDSLHSRIDALEASPQQKLVVLVPGLYGLYDMKLRQRASIKIFIDCDPDTRLNRWMTQDVLELGKPLPELLDHYLKISRPEFNEFINPTREYADVILQSENCELGVGLICDGIRENHNVVRVREDTVLNIYGNADDQFYELN